MLTIQPTLYTNSNALMSAEWISIETSIQILMPVRALNENATRHSMIIHFACRIYDHS